MREQIKEYFNFSKKERFGILILVLLIVMIGMAPAFYTEPGEPSDSTVMAAFRDQLAILESKNNDSGQLAYKTGSYSRRFNASARNDGEDRGEDRSKYRGEYRGERYGKSTGFAGNNTRPGDYSFHSSSDPGPGKAAVELFYFDPNTLDVEGWQRLGVREKTAVTIDKYRSKGGRFRKPEDLLKIFGLGDADKKRLMPFVKIVESSLTSDTARRKTSSVYTNTKATPQKIDINSADTTDWRKLPGIGEILSQRIIKYRNRLGGFYSIEQVGEIYGLHDSVFRKIRPWLFFAAAPSRIAVNDVSVAILEQHPYIGRKLARAIIDFRDQHGPFKKMEDLKQLVTITPVIFEKVAPYLEL